MPLDRIEVMIDRKRKSFWYHLKHRNGKIEATSEVYTRPASARKMAKHLASRLGLPLKEVEVPASPPAK
jgi:uncharacterized protein YegP (UPF0339 family)